MPSDQLRPSLPGPARQQGKHLPGNEASKPGDHPIGGLEGRRARRNGRNLDRHDLVDRPAHAGEEVGRRGRPLPLHQPDHGRSDHHSVRRGDGVGRFGLRQDVLRVYSRIFLRTRLDGPGVLVGEQEHLRSLEL